MTNPYSGMQMHIDEMHESNCNSAEGTFVTLVLDHKRCGVTMANSAPLIVEIWAN